MFEGVDGAPYFTAQWFYRAKDTVIKTCSDLIDDKRVFLSTIKDDNPLDCLLEKIKVVELPLNINLDIKMAALSNADYYYDMMYYVPFSSFLNSQHDNMGDGNESESTISTDTDAPQVEEHNKVEEMKLLDLFSGCGAMSTGLCLGANMFGIHLVTAIFKATIRVRRESFTAVAGVLLDHLAKSKQYLSDLALYPSSSSSDIPRPRLLYLNLVLYKGLILLHY